MPSSAISTGILPSGFCDRRLSLALVGSAGSTVTSPSRPRTETAIRTLRPNGEGSDERMIIIATPCTDHQLMVCYRFDDKSQLATNIPQYLLASNFAQSPRRDNLSCWRSMARDGAF